MISPPNNIDEWFCMPFRVMWYFPHIDFYQWLKNETKGRFYKTHSHIYFECEIDAVMYALRWS